MEFLINHLGPDKNPAACVVVGTFEKGQLSPAAQQLDRASNGALAAILQRGDLQGKPGQTLLLYQLPNVMSPRVLMVGLGDPKDVDEGRFREVVSKAAAAIGAIRGAGDAALYLAEVSVRERDAAWKTRQQVELIEASRYRFEQWKSKPAEEGPRWAKTTIVVAEADSADAERALKQGQAIAGGMKLVRDLGNLPPNICTPAYLGDEARKLGDQYGFNTNVLEVKDMESLGMGALLSVARGSRQPAKLITLEYRGNGDAAPIALVGKGITFDSGGVSIKPAANMDEMKYDMCGAATVLGTLKACAEMKLPLNVVGVIPSSENMMDGNASKPGDIVKSLSGQTIEILNTDAEGRLILCDALTYTERFKPALVIDIATLTGACVIALGNHATGLFTRDDDLARELLDAGEHTWDRAWRLPLWEDYQKQLDSNFADMANVGGREAGAITAASFLARFTKKFPWAHLDVAGTAWKTGKEKGATGRPVPLLAQFLINRCGQT